MNSYAFDLTNRQSSRVLEQAARARSQVYLEPADAAEGVTLSGWLIEATSEVLVIHLAPEHSSDRKPICGQYYQAIISVHQNRYLASTSIVELEARQEGPVLIVSRPSTVQVLQRRKYERMRLGQSVPICLAWKDPDGGMHSTPAMGQIQDIHLEGMGMKLPLEVEPHLFIGEIVHVRFSLNARQPDFDVAATICHKHIDAKRAQVIVGLQFELDASSQARQFQKRLGEALNAAVSQNKPEAGH